MQHYYAGLVQQQGSKPPLRICCDELASFQHPFSKIEGTPGGQTILVAEDLPTWFCGSAQKNSLGQTGYFAVWAVAACL